MKRVKLLMVVVLGILLLPFSVFAEEDVGGDTSVNEENKKVNIYFFRGEGCGFCQKAGEFFDSIQEEYGEYFTIKDYETWNNADNAKLLERVADARNETVEGVPYIIIGDKSWDGFHEDYQDEIIEQIKKEYETDVADRYDIMELLGNPEEKKINYFKDTLILILFVAVIGGIGAGVAFARKKTA